MQISYMDIYLFINISLFVCTASQRYIRYRPTSKRSDPGEKLNHRVFSSLFAKQVSLCSVFSQICLFLVGKKGTKDMSTGMMVMAIWIPKIIERNNISKISHIGAIKQRKYAVFFHGFMFG